MTITIRSTLRRPVRVQAKSRVFLLAGLLSSMACKPTERSIIEPPRATDRAPDVPEASEGLTASARAATAACDRTVRIRAGHHADRGVPMSDADVDLELRNCETAMLLVRVQISASYREQLDGCVLADDAEKCAAEIVLRQQRDTGDAPGDLVEWAESWLRSRAEMDEMLDAMQADSG